MKYKQEEIYPINNKEDCMIWIDENSPCVLCGEDTNAYLFNNAICSHKCRGIIESSGRVQQILKDKLNIYIYDKNGKLTKNILDIYGILCENWDIFTKEERKMCKDFFSFSTILYLPRR